MSNKEIPTQQKRKRGRPKGSKDHPTIKRKPTPSSFSKTNQPANNTGRPKAEFTKAREAYLQFMEEHPDAISPIDFFMYGFNGFTADKNPLNHDFSAFQDKDKIKCAEGVAKYIYSQHAVVEEVKTEQTPEEMDRQIAALLKGKLGKNES